MISRALSSLPCPSGRALLSSLPCPFKERDRAGRARDGPSVEWGRNPALRVVLCVVGYSPIGISPICLKETNS